MNEKPLSIEERRDGLARMARDGVDVLVIGGGITGAGVALDAAARGYRVGLVEKADFASGTSSKSTKLVHGGIRYLSQFDFALTRESLVERGLLLRNAPFLVQPIGFLLPLYAGAKKPMGTPIRLPFGFGMGYILRAGLILYDMLAGRLGLQPHRRLSKTKLSRMAPCLKTDKLEDAFIYFDGQTDDTRLVMTVLRTAVDQGASIANYAEVTGFEMAGGQIDAVHIADRLGGEGYSIRARKVVNAAGASAGTIEEMAGVSSIRIKPAKGVHLTVARESLKMGKYAMVLPETDDGRLLFLVPWGPRVTIGTTDTEGGDINDATAGPADIEYLLRHVNRYMRCRLEESDIISAWAGYRPLISSRKSSAQSSKLSRTHAVLDGPGGMVSIVGGKLTTYRRMAQDTVDHLVRGWGKKPPKHSITANLALEGTADRELATADLESRSVEYGLEADVIRRLSLYGTELFAILDIMATDAAMRRRIVPDLPYVMAEVVYACRREMVANLDDVLERRVHISFEDRDRGTTVAPAVAEVMAVELGWDAAEVVRQVERYRRRTASDARWSTALSGGKEPERVQIL
ncbi:MAG: glycerol-3-phosphate dehydrogenase/oxidase [Chloroflexota bacterium]